MPAGPSEITQRVRRRVTGHGSHPGANKLSDRREKLSARDIQRASRPPQPATANMRSHLPCRPRPRIRRHRTSGKDQRNSPYHYPCQWSSPCLEAVQRHGTPGTGGDGLPDETSVGVRQEDPASPAERTTADRAGLTAAKYSTGEHIIHRKRTRAGTYTPIKFEAAK